MNVAAVKAKCNKDKKKESLSLINKEIETMNQRLKKLVKTYRRELCIQSKY